MCTPPPPPPLLSHQLAPRAPPLTKLKKAPTGPPGDRQALLADIRNAGAGGVRLKPTKTNDRSAPIIGSVVSNSVEDRSPVNFSSPSTVKASVDTPVDFASELSRAISAQQNRTLKKFNGGTPASQSGTGHHSETRVKHGQHEKPPIEKRLVDSQGGEKVRPAPVGPKPTLSQNKTLKTSRAPVSSTTSRDGLSPANKETAGVSVKALREKLQKPPAVPAAATGQRKVDESNRVSQRIQQMSSAPSLVDSRCAVEAAAFSKAAQQPPPLPAKPPSRKPSIEHRKNVTDKFRTLKPQSVQQVDSSTRSNRFRSNSSENLVSVAQPVAFSLDSNNGHSGAKCCGPNGMDSPSYYGQRQVGHQPTPPPRPDVAPPPPPYDALLPHRLFGCRSSLNVPPPPPRGDSLTHDLERTFTFVEISRLPPPPEFRHVRSVKRAAPKAPMTDRAY